MSVMGGYVPLSVRADLARDGLLFIPNVIVDQNFLAVGVVYGRDDDFWWAIVDPRVHPLCVWKKRVSGIAAYGTSAQALNAAVFTNGPMMGKRLGPTHKITRGSAAWEFAKWTGAGVIAGLVVGLGWRSPYLWGVGGAAIGIAHAWSRAFTNWVPCGAVRSRDGGIDDRRNFDDQGETHAWFGRFGKDFSSYCIGEGDLPDGVCEGLGGLILLVRSFTPASTKIGHAAFNRDFAQLSKKKGVVAWGLVPIDPECVVAPGVSPQGRRAWDRAIASARCVDRQGPSTRRTRPEGVIVVIGGQKLDCEIAAARLCAIGTRDAVAMDQSACVMMGAARHFMIGPPPLHRQEMQLYGLYCR
jgi:hypothetical protein